MQRKTRQREAIERVLKDGRRPLTPLEIHERAHRHLPGIGLRTVYRQIEDLAGQQKIVGIDYPGQPLRYEWVKSGHHPHFICRRCNRLFDLPEDNLPDLPVKVPAGFVVDGQETIFYGLCSDCR